MSVNHLSIKDQRVGLVLSGGGGKGAYQVGIVQCLSDFGIEIDAIAGTSIGALNGAVLASAPSLLEASIKLQELWLELADAPPDDLKFASSLFDLSQGNRPKLKSSGRLEEIIDYYLNEEALNCGIPLYVGVFKCKGVMLNLAWAIAGKSGILDSPKSEFLCVQGLPRKEIKSALLASAALPLLFSAQDINGVRFVDGGIGGSLKCYGNTPITPLISKAGCRCIIVNHLSDGSLWNRNDFPDVTCLEIRPGKPIYRKGGLADMLTFDKTIQNEWIQQGYEDTKRCLTKSEKLIKSKRLSYLARQASYNALKKLIEKK